MKRFNSTSIAVIGLIVVMLAMSNPVWAQKGKPQPPPACPTPVPVLAAPTNCVGGSGCLDLTFGVSGIATTTDWGPSFAGGANAVALQSDGKILAAGYWLKDPYTHEFAVVRYHSDGTLDASFGSGGIVKVAGVNDALAVALQPDGKIVVAGGAEYWIVRLNPDGSLDTTFGDGGKKQLDTGLARAVALQSDGKIVVAGDGSRPLSGRKGATTIWKIFRLAPDGSLDASFGTAGKVEIVDGSGDNRVYAVSVQRINLGSTEEERILVGGNRGDNFRVMRLNPNGSPDTTFGPQRTGSVLTDICGVRNWLQALALDGANNIFAAGATSWGGGFKFALTRYSENGIPDTAFGGQGTGIVITDIFPGTNTWDFANGLAIQPNGKIIAGGWASTVNLDADHFALVRYNSDGTLDPSFGVGGAVAVYVTDGAGARVAIQPWDGKIVHVGRPYFAVMRIWP